jgi:hypothetical protein
MRGKLIAALIAMAMGLTVSVAWACPKDKQTADGKKGGCSKSAAVVSATVEDGRSETTDGEKKDTPCSKSAATTVADKAPCGKSATTVADKKPCGTGCGDGCPCSALMKAGVPAPCSKSAATTVADKAPCGGSATTVADKKPCGTGCGDGCPCSALMKAGVPAPCNKSAATTVADKAPCGGSATTVADKKGGCDKPCHGKASLTADGGDGCPIGAKVKAVLASLPSMKYRVGEETVGCAESAKKMAESSGKSVEYVVGEETFSDQGAAMTRLAAVLEEEVTSMRSIQYVAGGKCHKCPVTARTVAESNGGKVLYRVAGVDFEAKEAAETALEKAAQAVEKVSMSYKVGDKTYNCNKTAGEKCKESGAKLTYVIGEEETPCETAAKAKLAEARIRSMVETVVVTSMSL